MDRCAAGQRVVPMTVVRWSKLGIGDGWRRLGGPGEMTSYSILARSTRRAGGERFADKWSRWWPACWRPLRPATP
jgi:hypothetical protein